VTIFIWHAHKNNQKTEKLKGGRSADPECDGRELRRRTEDPP
jgi:hypothetical protein